LEEEVYNSNPRMEELKENIFMEIANIPGEQLQRVPSSTGARTVYAWRDSIFSTSCDL
jgi:hypothetical protein